MEEMSKKTKRLEKENENLKKKHDAMNKNILKMAEERTKHMKEVDVLSNKNNKLTSIINQMQQQGRGIPQSMTGTVESCYAEPGNGPVGAEEEDEEDSDYYEGEEASEEGEYEEDTEEDIAIQERDVSVAPAKRPFGPPRPPVNDAAYTTASNITNGLK